MVNVRWYAVFVSVLFVASGAVACGASPRAAFELPDAAEPEAAVDAADEPQPVTGEPPPGNTDPAVVSPSQGASGNGPARSPTLRATMP